MNGSRSLRIIGAVVLAGVFVAGSAQALPGRNTVDSGDIQNGQVKRPDIRSNAVNSAKVADNSLTSADINESTLALGSAGCKLGLVHSFARVKGSDAMPSTFTSSSTYVDVTHNCAGGTVEVRRVQAGVYCVRFNGDPAVLAQVSSIYDGSGTAHDFSAVDSRGLFTCGADAFRVLTHTHADDFVDGWFNIVTY